MGFFSLSSFRRILPFLSLPFIGFFRQQSAMIFKGSQWQFSPYPSFSLCQRLSVVMGVISPYHTCSSRYGTTISFFDEAIFQVRFFLFLLLFYRSDGCFWATAENGGQSKWWVEWWRFLFALNGDVEVRSCGGVLRFDWEVTSFIEAMVFVGWGAIVAS